MVPLELAFSPSRKWGSGARRFQPLHAGDCGQSRELAAASRAEAGLRLPGVLSVRGLLPLDRGLAGLCSGQVEQS